MAAADPLDGGRRPSPGRVAGAAAGRRDRPFQGRRDAAEGPAQNPAAPNQHDHLVIMFADQFADPLSGRDATGTGVDLPASRHDAGHDTTPVGPSSARAAALHRVFGPDRARSCVDVPPTGPRGRPKSAFSPGRPAPRPTAGVVSSPRSDILRSTETFSFSQTPPNKRNLQRLPEAGPRFFVSRAPDRIWSLRNHKTGCARLEKSPIRRAPLAETGRLPRASLALVSAFQANIGRLRDRWQPQTERTIRRGGGRRGAHAGAPARGRGEVPVIWKPPLFRSGSGTRATGPRLGQAVDWKRDDLGWAGSKAILICCGNSSAAAVAAPPRDALPRGTTKDALSNERE